MSEFDRRISQMSQNRTIPAVAGSQGARPLFPAPMKVTSMETPKEGPLKKYGGSYGEFSLKTSLKFPKETPPLHPGENLVKMESPKGPLIGDTPGDPYEQVRRHPRRQPWRF